MLLYPVLLVVTAVVSALLTKLVRDFANRFGLASGPSSARHIHAAPIPRLGGIAIFLTFLFICFLYWMGVQIGQIHHIRGASFWGIFIPATGLFAVGLIDDFRGLKPLAKLTAQIAGGVFLYYSGFRLISLHDIAGNGFLQSLCCLALTVGCVVLICNAINLIDGLDGLAAGAALFSMVTIFTFAIVNGRHGAALAVTILAGANLGFLVFNLNPASIFLGDSGSLFIGFMLSGLVMSESMHQSDPLRSILVPIIALALPLTDLFVTVLRRYLAGHSVFGADQEHIHHKLLQLGLSQRQVVWILYGVSASCAVLSLAFLYPSRLVFIPVFAVVALLAFFGLRKLNYQEFSELETFVQRIGQQKRVAATNITLRKAAAQLTKTTKAVEIRTILEHSLKSDFDGFKIVLDPGHWVTLDLDDAPRRVLEKSWSNSNGEKLTLTMDLMTARYGRIGRVSLDHSEGKRLLVDSNLLQRELRSALGAAIEHCLITMPEDFSKADVKEMAQGA
jgi:UDP-GlcNAc:undecaprenyl-phosphate GlcNAc-1-phosphate transferase